MHFCLENKLAAAELITYVLLVTCSPYHKFFFAGTYSTCQSGLLSHVCMQCSSQIAQPQSLLSAIRSYSSLSHLETCLTSLDIQWGWVKIAPWPSGSESHLKDGGRHFQTLLQIKFINCGKTTPGETLVSILFWTTPELQTTILETVHGNMKFCI